MGDMRLMPCAAPGNRPFTTHLVKRHHNVFVKVVRTLPPATLTKSSPKPSDQSWGPCSSVTATAVTESHTNTRGQDSTALGWDEPPKP